MKDKKNSFREIFSRNKKAYISVFVCLFVVYALLVVGIGNTRDNNSDLDNIDNNQSFAGNSDNEGKDATSAPTRVPQITAMPDITNVPPTPVSDSQSAGSSDVSIIEERPVAENTPTENRIDFNLEDGLAWPVKGDIIMPYSIDHAVYHETLNQFMTNDGLLIDSKNGEIATACSDALVTDIYTDTRRGLCVELSAGDYTFVYGQLSSSSVNVGDTVNEGVAVGMVGEPTRYYSEEGAHLYFKVMNGDETLDPAELLR